MVQHLCRRLPPLPHAALDHRPAWAHSPRLASSVHAWLVCLNAPSTKMPHYEVRQRVVSITQPRLCLGMPPGRGHCRVIPRLNRNAKKNRMETCRTRCAPMPHTSFRVGGEGPMGAGPALAVRLLAFCSLKRLRKLPCSSRGCPRSHTVRPAHTRALRRGPGPLFVPSRTRFGAQCPHYTQKKQLEDAAHAKSRRRGAV